MGLLRALGTGKGAMEGCEVQRGSGSVGEAGDGQGNGINRERQGTL